MKLSDAIVLGSTEINFNPRYWLCDDGACLLGMGGYAVGVRYLEDWDERQKGPDEIQQIRAIWSWLSEEFEVPQFLRELPSYSMNLPFFYVRELERPREQAVAIISMMACHIKEGHMTMEQAIDWIRENEPKEVVQPEVKTETEEVCELAKL